MALSRVLINRVKLGKAKAWPNSANQSPRQQQARRARNRKWLIFGAGASAARKASSTSAADEMLPARTKARSAKNARKACRAAKCAQLDNTAKHHFGEMKTIMKENREKKAGPWRKSRRRQRQLEKKRGVLAPGRRKESSIMRLAWGIAIGRAHRMLGILHLHRKEATRGVTRPPRNKRQMS